MATPMHHFNMQNSEQAQQLMDLLTAHGITDAVVTSVGDYAGYWQRITISNDGQLMTMKKGSSHRGYPLSRVGQISVPAELLLPVKPDTLGKKAAMTLIKYRNYFQANCVSWLWMDLRARLESMDSIWLAELTELNDWRAVYDKKAEKELSGIETYKSTTLASQECPTNIQAAIAAAFEDQRKGRWDWRGRYDYSVSLEPGRDGKWRAYFDQEYHGCGNGHYWLLISPTQALFAEDD